MLLNTDEEPMIQWTLPVLHGKASNHVQASTVTRPLIIIICVCKYVEMIMRTYFIRELP